MKRLAWIDNLRIMVIITVVFLHSAVTYSGMGGWYYKEGADIGKMNTIFFALFLTFTQAYFMSLLFMVSGYFSRKSLGRKSAWQFLFGRLKRLGIPLLVFIFLIHPLAVILVYPDLDIREWYFNGIVNFQFIGWTGPLWFVEALLIFTILYGLIRHFFFPTGRKLSFRLSILNVLLMILGITFFAFVLRLVYPIGTNFYNLQFGFFSAYIFMFAFGIIAFTAGIFEKITLRDGWQWLLISLGIGIPAWFVLMVYGGPFEGKMLIEGGMNWPAFFYALWESFFCVTFILALIGIFRHKLDISGPFQKALSDNAFGVFVFHTPILIVISMLLKNIEIAPIPKFLLVAVLAVTTSFCVSWLIRRVPLFRKVFS